LKERLKLWLDPNNAMLVQYRTYDTSAPEREALREDCGGSWELFLQSLSALRTDSFPGPHAKDLGPVLRPLIEAGCPAPEAAVAAAPH
jgi:hypothetical protein